MKNTLIFFVSLLMVLSFYSCASPSSNNVPTGALERLYKGETDPIDPEIITTLGMDELGKNSSQYLGSFVETEGVIKTLCPVGCFFFMEDSSRTRFYVNMSPNNFDVPQAALGERVRVMGILEMRGTLLSIMAFEVEFLDVNS